MVQQEVRLRVADNRSKGVARDPCYGWFYQKICEYW